MWTILFARLMPYMSLSFGWTSLDHYIRTWPICSHTVTHHQFGAWAEDPFICNHGNVDTTQFFGKFFLFLLSLILTSPRIRTMCWTSMGPLPPLMWMTGGAGDWWAEDIQNNIT